MGSACGRCAIQCLGGTRDTQDEGEDQHAEEASRRVAQGLDLSLVGWSWPNACQPWSMWLGCVGAAPFKCDLVEISQNILYPSCGKASPMASWPVRIAA